MSSDPVTGSESEAGTAPGATVVVAVLDDIA